MHRFSLWQRRQIVRNHPYKFFEWRNRKMAMNVGIICCELVCVNVIEYQGELESGAQFVSKYKSIESEKLKKPNIHVSMKFKKLPKQQKMNILRTKGLENNENVMTSSYFEDIASKLNYYESLSEHPVVEVDSQSNSLIDLLKIREKLLIQGTKDLMTRYEMIKMQMNSTGFLDVSWCIQQKQEGIMIEMEKELNYIKSNIDLLLTNMPKPRLDVVKPLKKLAKPPKQISPREKLFGLLKSLSKYEAYSNETPRLRICKAFSWDWLKELFESNIKLQRALLALSKSKEKSRNYSTVDKAMETEVCEMSRIIPKVLDGSLTNVDEYFKTMSFRIEYLQFVFNKGYMNNRTRAHLTEKACMILDSTFEIMKNRISKHKSSKLICTIALCNEANIPKCEDCIFCDCLEKCLLKSTTVATRCGELFISEPYDEIDKIIINEMYEEEEQWQNFDRQEIEVLKLALEQLVLKDED